MFVKEFLVGHISLVFLNQQQSFKTLIKLTKLNSVVNLLIHDDTRTVVNKATIYISIYVTQFWAIFCRFCLKSARIPRLDNIEMQIRKVNRECNS